MKKHSNLMLLLISLALFIYAGLLSIYPAVLTSTFNVQDFEDKIHQSTTLTTKMDSVNFKMTPNLNLIITITNWSSKYIYEVEQDCFDAAVIELTTNPFSVLTKNFKIKNLYLNNVVFSNQLLPEGVNKLAFLPGAFNARVFGKNKITIVPDGKVTVKNFTIKYIAPDYYKESVRPLVEYTKSDVKEFLQKRNFVSVNIK